MGTLKSSLSLFTRNPNFCSLSFTPNPIRKPPKISRVSLNTPPPSFDFRSEILEESQAAIARTHSELLDLAENGSLVLIEKKRFGPVPDWRKEFVEPEAIWLIGTTHISKDSALDVQRVINAVKPDNVVVELSEFIFRAGIMYSSDDNELKQQMRSSMFSLSGTGFFGAVGRSINLGGQMALALRLLLAAFSSKISSDVNRPFGDEFRAARKVAEAIGAQIVLGDRPIEITLERAWNSLDWKEKLSFLGSVVHGIASSNNTQKTGLQDSDRSDSTFQLYKQLSLSYPSLLQPLIYERDTYLAWSLKRSKAVNNGKRVVGVIGKGHMNGVIYALVSDQGDLRFRDLVGKRQSNGGPNDLVNNYLKNLVRDTIIGIVLWQLFELIKT
ncbi:TraB/PrgY/GumN family [Dillenia turbinata]|uniref:TraB/PrgY/GumN family n=1 Tax=Dillenia turbinata TaxID=194707 RepID=A0AAN8VV82_9MAGN